MKILLLITLISFTITQAQIVNIPDANFKNALLDASPNFGHHTAKDLNGNWVTIDTNNDNEIQINEALLIGEITVYGKQIVELTGIEYFSNLTILQCSSNQIENIDITQNVNLVELLCSSNQIINLNVDQNIELEILRCGNNQISTLNTSLNSNLITLSCFSNQLSTLDVSQNINLEFLTCLSNQIDVLDLTQNISLTNLDCRNNQLTNLELQQNENLVIVKCSSNQITDLIITNLTLLQVIEIENNEIENIDLSNNPSLQLIYLDNNLNLTYINLKNGNNINIYVDAGHNGISINNCINLENICIDDINSTFVSELISTFNLSNTFTEYCSLTPALNNQINGNIKLDLNNNGCDSSDLPISNLMLLTNNGTDNFATFTQTNGDYLLYTNEGNFTTEVTTNLPNYFTINPNSETNTFTGFNNTFTADFCIEPNQTVNDVNISLNSRGARPGFNATYQIVYKNVGTTQLNGNVTLEFDDTKLSFLNASETVNTQTSNSLTFNYTNLNPFETRTIDLEFNVFAPPTVEIDDILNFTATINPIAGDFTTDDNIFALNQIVIGSYDPNDITCLEGNEILLADTDKYLHYLIRFQNTGTASAINIVVTNDLDTNLDWSTLQLESLSHDNRVAIKNGNEIEFIFENINLPDSTTDEPNSHGFIAYKIKPKTDIALGDVIPNKADIFFDFNEAIETNIATTTIVNALSVNENRLLDFSVYPTPTENILNIKSKTEITKIEIYSKLGQLIKETKENQIDISNLTQGLYFVKVEGVNGDFGVKKIVKK